VAQKTGHWQLQVKMMSYISQGSVATQVVLRCLLQICCWVWWWKTL